MIDRYGKDAARNGVKIVPFCGFDSIPGDLGALLVADYAKNKLNRECGDVTSFVGPLKGGASGGTLATVMDSFEAGGSRKLRQPYALSPEVKDKRAPSDVSILVLDRQLYRHYSLYCLIEIAYFYSGFYSQDIQRFSNFGLLLSL
jgi:short subunit dehydrogenase-like uncharacterized protein